MAKMHLKLTAVMLFTALTVSTTFAANSNITSKKVVVKISNMKFIPSEITVPKGTTVTWINEDPFSHDVTSGKALTGRKVRNASKTKFPDGLFSSGLFGEGRSFSYTFEKAGIHPYFCNIHPFMVGSVTVKDK